MNSKIKKLISVALTLVMAFTVFGMTPYLGDGAAHAASCKGKTTDTVNVRTDANAGSSKLGTLDKGKSITIDGVKKASDGVYWYKTKYNSKTGYVSSKYVTRTGYTTTSISKVTGTVKGSDINLRLGPGTGYQAIARANSGQTYTANGKATDGSGLTWYRISYDGLKVYISSNYFVLQDVSAEAAPTTVAPTTTTQTSTSGPTVNAKVIKGGNVRTGPGTSFKKIGSLSKGKTTKVLGADKASDGVYWYKIIYNNQVGYIKNVYLQRNGYKTSDMSKKTYYAKQDGSNIRLGPGTQYPILANTYFGQKYTANGKSTESSGKVWYRVSYSGLKVYISSDCVQTSAPTQPSPAVQPTAPVTPPQNEAQVDPQAPAVTVSGLTYPTSLNQGRSFTLAGTLTCAEKMTKVEAGIQDAGGNWASGLVASKTVNSTTFDINKNIDSVITFGKLPVGNYKYVCNVTTSYGTVQVFSYAFSVIDAPAISLSGVTYPTALSQYKSFALKGTVKSTKPMSALTLGITDSAGNWLNGFNFTVNPNSTSYDLSKLDDNIKFGSLPTGSYCYKCVVTAGDLTQTVFAYSFVVNINTGIPQTLPYGNLSGNKRNDIVQIAMAQAGYKTNKENHTAYNLWYYGKDTSAAWCAIFVSWCANQAGVSTGVIPKMAYVPSITSWYKSKGTFHAKKTLPKKGDLIIYAGSSHIGIVTEDVTSTNGYVSTIEGNTGNDEAKYRKNYMKWNSSNIKGYCSPAY